MDDEGDEQTMEEIDSVMETEHNTSKKRKRCPELWKRNVAKMNR